MDDQEVFPGANMGGELASSSSMDSFFDDLFKETHACTHAHTCNPPDPDYFRCAILNGCRSPMCFLGFFCSRTEDSGTDEYSIS
ncbi:hypothetical protein EV2_026779 [Malus domestica]